MALVRRCAGVFVQHMDHPATLLRLAAFVRIGTFMIPVSAFLRRALPPAKLSAWL
jgi:hypothetical protein